MVKEQRIFLDWAKTNMSPESYLKVMYDSAQAIGWINESRTDDGLLYTIT